MQLDGGTLYPQIETQLPSFIQTQHGKFTTFIKKYYEFLELNLLTFNDLNLNEDKPIQEVADVTLTVTVATGNNAYSNAANKFYVGGEVSPTISVNTGTTYIFDQSDSTNVGHILRISTTPDGRHSPEGTEYSNGINVVAWGEPGTATAQTSVYIEPDLANTYLYYFCNNHSGMGGSVSIANTTPYITLESSNSTVTEYIDFENPGRQGDQFLSGETIEGANSGATGIVRGKFSTTQAYVEETNHGSFELGERIVGKLSRVSANVTAYSRQPLNASRNIPHFQDIDKAPAGFVELFRKEFLEGVPRNVLADKTKVLKNIKDFYRAKGNENSYKYIFRILYGKEDVSFYYPSTDILRLSDGRWTIDKTLKIDFAGANNFGSFEGRTVVGSTSNVRALIERTQTYQIGSSTISELYISNIDANNAAYNAPEGSPHTSFVANEKLTTTVVDDDGNYATANTTGILASVTIDSGGSNYSVGDELSVSGGGGQEGAVKVASVTDATISAFDIIDAGDGYSVGDTVTFVNEGTGGSGGAARVQSIIPTANVFLDSYIINTFKDDQISVSAFTSPLNTVNANTHLFSNSTTTFSATVSGTVPKKGDLLFYAEQGGYLSEDGKHLLAESGNDGGGTYGGNEFDQAMSSTINDYDADTAIFGTVVNVSGTTVTYALGSVNIDPITGSKTIRNFSNGLAVDIYDTQKDGTGATKSANGHNAVVGDTGSNMTFASVPAAVTDTTKHGALPFTESEIGAIRSIQVLSSGQGYKAIPVVTVANSTIESYQNAPAKLGSNSIFLTLGSTVANDFSGNTIIKNSTNTATGLVLDYIDKPTTLVSTGNTVLRVQMTSSNNFSASDTITAYVNDADENPVGIGDFGSANIASSGTTGIFTQTNHGFSAGQRIVVTGSASGTDAALYNNNHTIASVTNTSTYTVTFPSTPTDTSETSLTVRRIVSGNTATTNTVFANTGPAGNNATISIASIAIGAIQSVTIYNFGANYTTVPTLSATSTGDGNATLSAKLGALAEYDGFFNGTQGLLSGRSKVEDNYYYQDFSYVIKTDVDVASYRDKILDLVHPAGLAMFGEVAMYQNASVQFFGGANTTNRLTANTLQVANTTGVPQYRVHEVTIANQNTASSNNQVTVAGSLYIPNLTNMSAPMDNRVNFPGIEYDLVLEQSMAGIALEMANDWVGFEDGDTLILDDGTSKLLFEEYESSIIQENNSNLELEGDPAERNYLLSEPTIDSVKVVSEDNTDIFNISMENDHDEYYIVLEDTTGDNLILETGFGFIGFNTSLNIPNMLVMEVDEYDYSTNFKVIERSAYEGFSIPKIQFPESESGAIHIDMGYGSQLRLETDTIGSISLEYSVVKNFLTENGRRLMTEAGEELIFVDDDTLMQEQGETGDLLLEDNSDNGLVLLEEQPFSETEGFDFELLVLEGVDGAFPVYLAMEDSMQDEIIKSHEIQICPMAYDEVPSENIGIVIDNVDGAADQTWLAEDGNRLVYDSLTESVSKASMVTRNDVDIPWGTGRSSSFSVRAEGVINSVGGEAYEFLTEAGDTYITESSGAEVAPRIFLSEAGDTYVLEHDSNLRLADTRASELDITKRLITAEYDRQPSIIGTATNFDQDFNAPIVLEDDDITLVAEGSATDGHRLVRERGEEDTARPFGAEHSDSGITSYITLETYTDDSECLLMEGTDRSFEPLQDEDGNNIGLESSGIYDTRRLLYNELLEVEIEEETIALEEDFKIIMEEDSASPGFTYLAENGDNLVLQQHAGNLISEDQPLTNIVNEQLVIGDHVANIAFEDNGSVILEERTPTSIGMTFLSENGDRLIHDGHDSDLFSAVFFLHEDSYARTFSEGQIKVTNDKRLATGGEPSEFITEDMQYLVAENGVGLDTESQVDNPTTVHIELSGSTFPHGVDDYARIIFADGNTGIVSEKSSDYLLEIDMGSILLENSDRTEEYLAGEEEGGRFKFDYHDSTLQTYRIEYGRYTQFSTVNENRVMKVEVGTTDTNNTGREYLYTPSRWFSTKGGTASQIGLEEFMERLGDDIVLEDSGQIMIEDGEINTNDPNAILIEDDTTYMTFEENDSVMIEAAGYDYKLLNLEASKYRIEYVANNTFMKFSNETHLFADMPMRVNHLEQVPL